MKILIAYAGSLEPPFEPREERIFIRKCGAELALGPSQSEGEICVLKLFGLEFQAQPCLGMHAGAFWFPAGAKGRLKVDVEPGVHERERCFRVDTIHPDQAGRELDVLWICCASLTF